MKNLAFIDGQNLYLGTKDGNWKIDYFRFRRYLREKNHVEEAYYFFGYFLDKHKGMYNSLEKAGFNIIFKEHYIESLSKKKGNVDTDVVFEIMRNLIERSHDSKFVLVSGDGDYKKTIDYLIQKDRFKKIMFPNKKFASSLYKKLGNKYFVFLDRDDTRKLIEHRNEKGA